MTPITTTPINKIARIFEMMTANESIKTPYTNHKLKAIRMILWVMKFHHVFYQTTLSEFGEAMQYTK